MSFEFTREGITYRVHSEVGSGPARVLVEEVSPEQQQAMEATGDGE